MRRFISAPASAVMLTTLLLAVPAIAHHGWSSYDADRTMTLETELDAVHYRNPHAEVEITHDGESWNVVLAPISRMTTRGLPDDALVEGKSVTIEGYPRNDGTRELRAERITVDGQTIELR